MAINFDRVLEETFKENSREYQMQLSYMKTVLTDKMSVTADRITNAQLKVEQEVANPKSNLTQDQKDRVLRLRSRASEAALSAMEAFAQS